MSKSRDTCLYVTELEGMQLSVSAYRNHLPLTPPIVTMLGYIGNKNCPFSTIKMTFTLKWRTIHKPTQNGIRSCVTMT